MPGFFFARIRANKFAAMQTTPHMTHFVPSTWDSERRARLVSRRQMAG